MKRLISFLLAFVMLLGMMPTAMAASPFSDVPADAYYYDAVLWAVEQGVTTGTGNGKFSPLMNCTRSQVVTFLWRAAGSPEPTATEMNFSDVPADAYYYDAVLWAVENNITTGTGGGKFSPLMACSRAQIVTFLWRSQGSPAVSGVANPFKDVPAGQYYTDAVLWAVKEGITTGTAADKFSPDMICTRSQIVTFLFRGVGMGDPGPELVIVTHPEDVTCVLGDEVRFLVEVDGGKAPYTYQWQVRWDGEADFVDLTYDDSAYYEGWNYEMLRFTAQESDFLYDFCYRCVVTDALGNSVTSDEAAVIEDPTLTVLTQPRTAYVDRDVTDGAKFAVEIFGGKAPYTYKWQWTNRTSFADGVISEGEWADFTAAMWWGPPATFVTDATVQKVSMTRTTQSEKYYFRCVITDAEGNTVGTDKVGFGQALKIAEQPEDCTIMRGEGSFTVSATGGAGDYEYRWQYKTNAMTDYQDVAEEPSFCTGHREATLTLDGMSTYNMYYEYEFRCIVMDKYGNSVVSNSARALEYEGLSVWEEPETAYAEVGKPCTITVKGKDGTGEYTYRWMYYSNKLDLDTQSLDTASWAVVSNGEVIITPPDAAWFDNEYKFYCFVRDGKNEYRTNFFSVKKKVPVFVSEQPEDADACWGDEVSFSVKAEAGDPSYTYQWQYTCDGMSGYQNLSASVQKADNWTTDTLKIITSDDEFEKNYKYRCVITDSRGVQAISDPVSAVHTVHLIPLTDTSYSFDFGEGEIPTLKVKACGGTGEYTYNWRECHYTYIYERTYSVKNSWKPKREDLQISLITDAPSKGFCCLVWDENGDMGVCYFHMYNTGY